MKSETAAHPQEVADEDLTTRIALGLPLFHRSRLIDLQQSTLDQHAHQRRRDALALRPADLRRVLRPAGCVAFADDLSAVRHHESAGVLFLLLHRPVEGGGHGLGVHAVRDRLGCPDVAGGPGLRGGVGKTAGDRYGLVVDVLLAGRQDRGALVAVVFGGARGSAGSGDRYHPSLVVNLVFEIGFPTENLERRDVLGDHFLWSPFVGTSHNPEPGADVVSGHGGAELSAFFGVLAGGFAFRRRLGRLAGRPTPNVRSAKSNRGSPTRARTTTSEVTICVTCRVGIIWSPSLGPNTTIEFVSRIGFPKPSNPGRPRRANLRNQE